MEGEYDYSRDVDVNEEANNRKNKRPYEGNDYGGRDSKRSNRNRLTKPTLKVLVPNMAVGKLIGEGGNDTNELENKYSANIEVAPARDFFPGTECRSVNLSAEIDQIIALVNYIIDDVYDERDNNTDFTLAITDFAVGFVMGRGGSVIKTIQEDSGAGIRIQKQNDAPCPGERTVTISGNKEQKRTAALAIIDKMSSEPMRMSKPHSKYESKNQSYDPYQQPPRHEDRRAGGFNLSSTLRGGGGDHGRFVQDEPARGYGGLYGGAGGMGLGAAAATAAAALGGLGGLDAAAGYEARCKAKTTFTVEMQIPNAMVGGIVGKSGSTINEIQRNSGAQISFSGKDEFVPGTHDRILTIKGSKKQVLKAHMLIDSKVLEVEHTGF